MSTPSLQLPPYEVIVNMLPGPRTPDMPTKVYTGGCHCGKFKFECRHPILEDGFPVASCNCSICTIRGSMYIYVFDREKDFKLLEGSLDECHKYQFKRKMFTHLSCPTCATSLFCEEPYNILAISVRSLDGISENLDKLTLKPMNGRRL